MQNTFSRRAFVAGLGMLSVPLIALAQDDKSREEKKKEAEKKAEKKKEEVRKNKDEAEGQG